MNDADKERSRITSELLAMLKETIHDPHGDVFLAFFCQIAVKQPAVLMAIHDAIEMRVKWFEGQVAGADAMVQLHKIIRPDA